MDLARREAPPGRQDDQLPVDADSFRSAMAMFPSGVTVVTSRHGDECRGITVSAFSSVSAEPPLVLVCLKSSSKSRQLIEASGRFAVHVLGSDHAELGLRFAGMTPDAEQGFNYLDCTSGVTGCPILPACLAWLDCTLTDSYPAGDHHVLVGEVQATGTKPGGLPILYYNREWRTLASEAVLPEAGVPPTRGEVMQSKYDIVVIGSGLAGTTSALVLRQLGMSVLVIERKTHPRFAIGESTVPETTLGFDYLARTYKIPELKEITHYLGLQKVGCAGLAKRHFWFGNHEPDRDLAPNHELMVETLTLPLGPDVHMLRADADAHLVKALPRYGVDYVDQTEVVDYEAHPECARLELNGPEGPSSVEACLVLDASGHASFFATKFGLRDEVPRLKSNTRSIFGHFHGVRKLDEALGGSNPDFRFRRECGTQHHCFEGGWAWVIPFDNDVTSVGFDFDIDKHPLDPDISAEEEIANLLDRYPSMRKHLGDMKPTRPLVRSGRIQFTSKTIIGDRYLLTPHAAAFVEPLFSTGIMMTQIFIARFAPLALQAIRQQRVDMEMFRPMEEAFFNEIEHVDRIVSGAFHAFGHYDQFKQWSRSWIHSFVYQYIGGVVDPTRSSSSSLMWGGGDPEWRDTVIELHSIVSQQSGDRDAVAAELKRVLDALPDPYMGFDVDLNSPNACRVHAMRSNPLYWDWIFSKRALGYARGSSWLRTVGFFSRYLYRGLKTTGRYVVSRVLRTPFHRHVDKTRWRAGASDQARRRPRDFFIPFRLLRPSPRAPE